MLKIDHPILMDLITLIERPRWMFSLGVYGHRDLDCSWEWLHKTKGKIRKKDWDVTKKVAYLANYKTINTIICEKNLNEFKRIFEIQIAKKAWDLLKVIYEGTITVKQYKLQMLTSSFESLRMEDDEKFIDFHTTLQDIMN